MAYNIKLHRSTGTAWEEIRLASDWSLISNKPATYTPTSHSLESHTGSLTISKITDLQDELDSRVSKGTAIAANTLYRFPTWNTDGIITGAASADVSSRMIRLNGSNQGLAMLGFGSSNIELYGPTAQLSDSTLKRYLIGSASTTSLATQNSNASVYMQNGELYSNSQKVWSAGNLKFTLNGTELSIEVT